MAMSEAQAVHLQSVTAALIGLGDAVDASLASAAPPDGETALALELANDIMRRVLKGESYDLAADAVRADWAAAGGGPIEDAG